MSIFGKIKSAIFGGEAKAAEPAATPAAEAAPAARAAITEVDVTARLDNIPGSDKLNWRTSIVDLMKLVQMMQAMQIVKNWRKNWVTLIIADLQKIISPCTSA